MSYKLLDDVIMQLITTLLLFYFMFCLNIKENFFEKEHMMLMVIYFELNLQFQLPISKCKISVCTILVH